MDMLDHRFHYAVMVTDDRIRSLHDEATVRRRLREGKPQPEPRSRGGRAWNLTDLAGVLVPSRWRRASLTLTSAEGSD
jgi:hypothetical protein